MTLNVLAQLNLLTFKKMGVHDLKVYTMSSESLLFSSAVFTDSEDYYGNGNIYVCIYKFVCVCVCVYDLYIHIFV